MSGYVKLASQITELIPIIKCIALEFGEKNGWNSFVQWDSSIFVLIYIHGKSQNKYITTRTILCVSYLHILQSSLSIPNVPVMIHDTKMIHIFEIELTHVHFQLLTQPCNRKGHTKSVHLHRLPQWGRRQKDPQSMITVGFSERNKGTLT